MWLQVFNGKNARTLTKRKLSICYNLIWRLQEDDHEKLDSVPSEQALVFPHCPMFSFAVVGAFEDGMDRSGQ